MGGAASRTTVYFIRKKRPARLLPMSRRLAVPLVASLGFASLGAGLLAACAGRDDSPRPPQPPAAEFLLATGDSTFWVATDSTGVRLRGAPMTLAHWDRHFYEVYVADDDRSFADAVFVGQRIFRRDLLSGDSVAVFDDTLIAREAEDYAAAHPAEEPLGPDDEGSDDPRTSATSEADLLDVYGPYLAYEYRADVDVHEGDFLHASHRGVIDLRTGRRQTLEALFGAPAAARIVVAGRQAFADALDSIRAAGGARARRAEAALAGLVFDPRSFALVADGARPAVSFLVPGRGVAAGLALPLPPVPAPEPEWWPDVARALPAVTDSASDRWARGPLEVVARYDTGDVAAITLRLTAKEWPIGRLPGPAHHLWWLDTPPLDSSSRHALVRAFDESALYSDETRVAAGPTRAGRPSLVRAVRLVGARPGAR